MSVATAREAVQKFFLTYGPDATLDADAVQAPDRILSEWVVASYRPEQNRASA